MRASYDVEEGTASEEEKILEGRDQRLQEVEQLGPPPFNLALIARS